MATRILLPFILLLATAAYGQNAEELFNTRCAACHVDPDPATNPHTPPLEAMRSFTPVSVYAAMKDGLMQPQAAGLSDESLRSLAAWITGREVGEMNLQITAKLCEDNPPLQDPASAPRWNGWGPDVSNTRFAQGAALSKDDLGNLKLLWAYGLPGETAPRAQPAVVGGRLYVGNQRGALYSLDAASGCTYWTYLPRTGIRSALSVAPVELADGSTVQAVFFIDLQGTVYAVDARSGRPIWQRKVDEHPNVRGTGSVTVHDGVVYAPITGVGEENIASNPDYSCCTFRGSITALDAGTGDQLWKYYTVPEPRPRGTSTNGVPLYGPAGVGIWSAPTIDAERGLVYAATGNAYAEPVPPTANAVIAVDIETGELAWTKQLLADDAWVMGCEPGTDNPNCPEDVGPDFDFSASPILATTAAGKDMIVVPQKSGLVYGLDPDNAGEVLWEYRVGPGSPVGGVWGSAVAGDIAYAPVGGYFSEVAGGMHAIDIVTGERLWYTPPQDTLCEAGQGCGPTQSAAVTAIEGAAFSGSQDGGMRAYDAETGEVLWTFDANREFETINGVPANGASFDGAGPVVAGDRLYILSGNGGFVGRPGNVLLVFGAE